MPPLDRQPRHGRAYWRSLEDLADTPEFREFMHREFPAGATDLLDSGERRSFLKIMGASLALAGLGLAGCRRWPKEQIAPFAHRPEGRVPGVPERYATSMELGGTAQGLVVTSYDGRPIKVEGNPQHPINRGATDGWAQASVLEMYDPERSRHVMHDTGEGREETAWTDFDQWAAKHFGGIKGARGSGLAILSEASESPSMLDMKARLLEALPRAAWYTYEPVHGDQELAGSAAAFGAAYRPHYAFDRARVVVSLDSDFLYMHPAAVKHTRDYAAGRGPGPEMSRLYVFESAVSLTGANADHRIAVRSRDVAAVAGHLAARLVPQAAPSGSARERFDRAPADIGLDPAVLDLIVEDLQRHRGESLVVAGPRQPAEVHYLAHLINEHLDNTGETVRYTARPDAEPSLPSIKTLAQEMEANRVDTLVILGGDPVYNAPANLDFGAKLDAIRTSIHLSLYDNATSRRCTWHVPRAHYLESWGDARAYDGTWSLVQPLIEPLFGGRSSLELLAAIAGDEMITGYDITRRTMAESASVTDFERMWRRALHDGFVAGSAATPQTPRVRRGELAAVVDRLWQGWSGGEGLEVVFVPDARVHDGRFANNGWLQELPDPVTKLTWDNAVIVGVAAAADLGVETGDLLRVTVGGRPLTGPALVMPGQHPGSVTIPLGYGQDLGAVSRGAGFDAYAARAGDAPSIAAGTIEVAGGREELALTQNHHAIDTTGGRGTQERLPTIFREATLREYQEHPDFAGHRTHVVHRLSLWPEDNLEGADYAWGMTIDLNKCTGCSACVVACQAENNIPIVGKEQVRKGRELHWIRVDRYFVGRDAGSPDHYALQPVACVMCENAPCEQVCPVAATTHDKDGLNVMVYNRCIGTRYCSNNCPYKVRRFNYFDYWTRRPRRESEVLAVEPEYYARPPSDVHPLRSMQLNPEVTVRARGVMEKCTYCIQRIAAAKIEAKNEWVRKPEAEKRRDRRVTVPDGSFTTACAQACPAEAIVFGDLMDPGSRVAALQNEGRSYGMLEEINTKPRTRYLARIRNPAPSQASPEEDHHG